MKEKLDLQTLALIVAFIIHSLVGFCYLDGRFDRLEKAQAENKILERYNWTVTDEMVTWQVYKELNPDDKIPTIPAR